MTLDDRPHGAAADDAVNDAAGEEGAARRNDVAPAGVGDAAAGSPGAAGRPRRAPLRTGRNLPVAVAVGLLLGAGVLLTLYTVKATFLVYMAAAVGLAGVELSRALAARGITIALAPLAAGCAAIWTCAYWLGPRAALAAIGLTAVAVIVWRLPGGAAGYVRDVTASVFVLTYLPVMTMFPVLILASRDGPDRMIMFIVVTICSDIGGYFTGIAVGRHQLVPAISPNKTWEGLAGSVVACVAVGAGLMPSLLGGQLWQGMILGVAAVAVATLGDLAESMIKRDLAIKDMGSVLPGHGGLLDRLDSLLLNAPVAWLLLAIFVPAGAR